MSRMAALESSTAAQHDMFSIIATLFDYTDDTASVTTVPAFKQELIRAYSAERQTGCPGPPLVFCTITGLYLPKQAREARLGELRADGRPRHVGALEASRHAVTSRRRAQHSPHPRARRW